MSENNTETVNKSELIKFINTYSFWDWENGERVVELRDLANLLGVKYDGEYILES